jgi:hypothetical protein
VTSIWSLAVGKSDTPDTEAEQLTITQNTTCVQQHDNPQQPKHPPLSCRTVTPMWWCDCITFLSVGTFLMCVYGFLYGLPLQSRHRSPHRAVRCPSPLCLALLLLLSTAFCFSLSFPIITLPPVSLVCPSHLNHLVAFFSLPRVSLLYSVSLYPFVVLHPTASCFALSPPASLTLNLLCASFRRRTLSHSPGTH